MRSLDLLSPCLTVDDTANEQRVRSTSPKIVKFNYFKLSLIIPCVF